MQQSILVVVSWTLATTSDVFICHTLPAKKMKTVEWKLILMTGLLLLRVLQKIKKLMQLTLLSFQDQQLVKQIYV